MNKITKYELDNIKQLLSSKDKTNRELGITLCSARGMKSYHIVDLCLKYFHVHSDHRMINFLYKLGKYRLNFMNRISRIHLYKKINSGAIFINDYQVKPHELKYHKKAMFEKMIKLFLND